MNKHNYLGIAALAALSLSNVACPKISAGKYESQPMLEKENIIIDSRGRRYQRQPNGSIRRLP